MPIARFQMPDGRIGRFEVPEGTSPENAQSLIQQHVAGSASTGPDVGSAFAEGQAHTLIPGQENAPFPERRPSAIAGIPGALLTTASAIPAALAGNVAAAAKRIGGGSMSEAGDTARDIASRFTYTPSPEGAAALDVAGKAFDASKLAGLVPNAPLAGAGSAIGPAMRYVGAAAGEAVGRAANPIADALEAARLQKRAALSPEAAKEAGTLRRAQEGGYRLLPTETNPSAMNSLLESIGGKVKTAQTVSQKNAPVTIAKAKSSAGIPADEALSPEGLNERRGDLSSAHDAVRGVGVIPLDDQYLAATGALNSRAANAAKSLPGAVKDDLGSFIEGLQNPALQDAHGRPAIDTNHAVDAIAEMRANGDAQFKSPTGDRKLGTAYRAAASELENLIQRHLDATPGMDPDLVENFRTARTNMAKTYDVESALNPATGSVSAQAIARRSKTRPLSGELKDIADIGQAQPKAVQRPEVIGGVPMGSIFDLTLASLAKKSLSAAATLGVRPAARALITSKPYQDLFVQPRDYAQPGLIERLARNLSPGEPGMQLAPEGPYRPPQAAAAPAPLADKTAMIAERLSLTDEPKPAGNEIDMGPFLNERRLAKAAPVEQSQAAETARQADAARAIPYEPVPVTGRLPLTIDEIANRLQLGGATPQETGLSMSRPATSSGVDRAIADEAIRRSGAVPQLVEPILRDIGPPAQDPLAGVMKTFVPGGTPDLAASEPPLSRLARKVFDPQEAASPDIVESTLASLLRSGEIPAQPKTTYGRPVKTFDPRAGR